MLDSTAHNSQCVSETNNGVDINAYCVKENLEKLLMMLCMHRGLFVKG